MNFFYSVTLTVCLIFLSGCTKSIQNYSKVFWIDNPTEETINFTIDNQEYNIPANTGQELSISAGKHILKYNNDSVQFVVKPNDQNVILNPTLSNYIFYHQIYLEKGKEDKALKEMDKIKTAYLYNFEIAPDTIIQVPFKVTNELFIEQYEYYWHLGLTEQYKDEVSINRGGSSLSTAPQSKIFREKDFYTFMGDKLSDIKFTESDLKLSDIPAYSILADTLSCNCEQAIAPIQKVKDEFKKLENVDQQDFRKAYDNFSRLRYTEEFNSLREICSKNDGNNYDMILVRLGKNIEILGRKNAYVIK